MDNIGAILVVGLVGLTIPIALLLSAVVADAAIALWAVGRAARIRGARLTRRVHWHHWRWHPVRSRRHLAAR